MNINEAARATRRWNSAYVYGYGKEQSRWVVCDGEKEITIDGGQHDAQATCDRLNLAAVLEALHEISGRAINAGAKALCEHDDVLGPTVAVAEIFEAMIDALLAELKETKSAEI